MTKKKPKSKELKIEYVDIDSILPYINNAKLHPPEQIAQIAASIKHFGFCDPIAIDESNTIIEGHGRLLAAQKLKLKTVPIIRLDHMSDADKKAYILTHNKLTLNSGFNNQLLKLELDSLKEMNFDLNLTGFSIDEISDLQIEIASQAEDKAREEIEDDVPEVEQNKFNVKRGDLWQLGRHFLLCADSTDKEDVEYLMDGKKADLLWTDPPYGVSYADKNAYLNATGRGNKIQVEIKNDHLSLENIEAFWTTVLNNACCFMKDKSAYYISYAQGFGLEQKMLDAVSNSGLQLKHVIIWVKNNHVLGRCDYNYKHEPILYGWKKDGTHEFYGAGKCKTSVWEFPKPLKNDLHPTMKPVELVEESILNSTKEDDIVLDLFLGSGTTLIACEKTNRICYGIELDPHYCSVIIQRYIDYVGSNKEVNLINKDI